MLHNCCGEWEGWDPVKWFNHTSWVAIVTPTDRPKSVRNRCVIKVFGGVFSAPEPKAQVHYCDHALYIVRRPSVVRPSSVCPSLTFHIFDFSSETTEQNSTKLDRKQDLNVLYQVCVFRADRKNKMAALSSDWPRHFRLLLGNRWTEFNETWQEARSQRPLPSLCFLGRSEKQDGRPGLWLAETFSTSLLKPLNGIQQNLTGSKISTSSTKIVFFGPIGKTRWPPWPLIGWDIFDFSSETAERNSRKLDRKQDLNVLYQVCVFGADRKNKMAALRPGRPSCFSDQPEKHKLGRGRWDLASCQVLLYSVQWFQRRSQKCLSQSEARAAILFFRSARKTQTCRGRWDLASCQVLLNSVQRFSEKKVENVSANQRPGHPSRFSDRPEKHKLLNVLYQVCVFRADRKNKMAALASDWLRHFWLLLWNHWTEYNKTWQEARSQRPLPSLCFSGRSEKRDGCPGLWLAETFSTFFSENRWTLFNKTWQEARSQRPLLSLCFACRSVNKNVRLGRFLKKVAHCTQVHDMWPFGPLVVLSRCFFGFFCRCRAFS